MRQPVSNAPYANGVGLHSVVAIKGISGFVVNLMAGHAQVELI